MNTMDITAQFERKNNDRIESPYVPKSPRVLNALKTSKSLPSRGLPRVSTLVRSPTTLVDPHLDLGLLDVCFDEGGQPDLDDTVRSMRFSTAASNIDAFFSRSSCNSPRTVVSVAVEEQPTHTENKLTQEKLQFSDQTLSQGRLDHSEGEATEASIGKRNLIGENTVNNVKNSVGLFEIEPVTPPRSELRHVLKSSNSTHYSSVALPKSEGEGLLDSSKDTSEGQREENLNESSPLSSNLRNSPKRIFQNTLQAGKRLSSLLSRRDGSADDKDTLDVVESHEHPQSTPRDGKVNLLRVFKRKSLQTMENISPKTDDDPVASNGERQVEQKKERIAPFHMFKRKTATIGIRENENESEENKPSNPGHDRTPSKERQPLLGLLKKLSSGSRRRASNNSAAPPQNDDCDMARETIGTTDTTGEHVIQISDTQRSRENEGQEQQRGKSNFLALFKRKSTHSGAEGSREESGEQKKEAESVQNHKNQNTSFLAFFRKLSSGSRPQGSEGGLGQHKTDSIEPASHKTTPMVDILPYMKSSSSEDVENPGTTVPVQENDVTNGNGDSEPSPFRSDNRNKVQVLTERLSRFFVRIVD